MLGAHLLVVAQAVADDVGAVVATPVAERVGLDFDASDRACEREFGPFAVEDGAKDFGGGVHVGNRRLVTLLGYSNWRPTRPEGQPEAGASAARILFVARGSPQYVKPFTLQLHADYRLIGELDRAFILKVKKGGLDCKGFKWELRLLVGKKRTSVSFLGWLKRIPLEERLRATI